MIVAITQQSFLRIKAGNGFVTTEFDHELVGPKLSLARALNWKRLVSLGIGPLVAKGKKVKIP